MGRKKNDAGRVIKGKRVEELQREDGMDLAKEDPEGFLAKSLEQIEVMFDSVYNHLDSHDYSSAHECFMQAKNNSIESFQILYSTAQEICASDISSGSKQFDLASKLSNDVINMMLKILKKMQGQESTPKAFIGDAKESLLLVKQGYSTSRAWRYYWLGIERSQNLSPEFAIEYFKDAQKEFDSVYKSTCEDEWKLWSDYSGAHQNRSSGRVNFHRGNLIMSKSDYGKAKAQLKSIIDEQLPNLVSNKKWEKQEAQWLGKQLKADLHDCEQQYCLTEARIQFNDFRFSEAYQKYDELCKIIEESLKIDQDVLSKELINILLGDCHQYQGYRFLAEGETFREREQWDKALESYRNTREEWDKAAEEYIQSGLPQGVAVQQILMNLSAGINFYEMNCNREKELKTKIKNLEAEREEFLQSLKTAMKSAGMVEVTNIQEASPTIQATFEFNIKIENQVKQHIGEIAKQIQDLDIADIDKRDISNEANNVINSEEHGPKFLERVKDFAIKAGEIANKAGVAAQSILPMLQALSMFTGIPMVG